MNEKSIENALIVDMAIGGSTNTAIHLPAIASELNIKMDLEKFNEISAKVPMIANISPSGHYSIVDLYRAGGIPAVMSRLTNFLNLDCLTVTGKPLKTVIKRAKVLDEKIIMTIEKPYNKTGGTVILKGNLAPNGAVVKQSAIEDPRMLVFEGPAKVFNSEKEAIDAHAAHQIPNGSAIIVRYNGPKGGPGMPELLAFTAFLQLTKNFKCALLTDARFSGATQGPMIGHICPEAYVGGPLAIIKDGDIIKTPSRNKKQTPLEI
jgi:dihydroxy-acid dehydratase